MNAQFWRLFKIGCLVVAVCLLTPMTASAETAEEKGRALMERIEGLPAVEKMISETILDIYDARGSLLFSKKSRTASFTENFRDKDRRLQRSINYFYAPADDKGNGALMTENPDGENDQWVYLKGLRKPKRILGSDKSSSFMGSDFTNGDIGARNLDDSTYTWLATESITFKGKTLQVEKIESVYKDAAIREDYGYSKTVFWMHLSSGLPFKIDMYNLSGQLEKQSILTGFSVQKNIDGERVFIPSGMEMKNVIKGTRTVMTMKEIKVETAAGHIQPEIFQISYLTRKWW